MREELSAENRALIYRLFGPSSGKLIETGRLPLIPASIDVILNEARSEARAKPPQPADDNHKALVEALTVARSVMSRELSPNACIIVDDALAAFQSRQEESAPFTKETDHGEE